MTRGAYLGLALGGRCAILDVLGGVDGHAQGSLDNKAPVDRDAQVRPLPLENAHESESSPAPTPTGKAIDTAQRRLIQTSAVAFPVGECAVLHK